MDVSDFSQGLKSHRCPWGFAMQMDGFLFLGEISETIWKPHRFLGAAFLFGMSGFEFPIIQVWDLFCLQWKNINLHAAFIVFQRTFGLCISKRPDTTSINWYNLMKGYTWTLVFQFSKRSKTSLPEKHHHWWLNSRIEFLFIAPCLYHIRIYVHLLILHSYFGPRKKTCVNQK